MEKENIQKELFEFEAPKKQPRRFGQFFQKADFALSLSAEKLVFISIGILMLLVVSFALGVEKGKAISGKVVEVSPIPAQAQSQRVPARAPVQQMAQPKEKTQTSTINAVTNVTAKEKLPAAQNLADKNKPYTIVAAAFSKETYATKEATRLKGSGFDAFVIKRDPYYLACVGSFVNKDGAKTVLNRVKQMYKDAYVRLR